MGLSHQELNGKMNHLQQEFGEGVMGKHEEVENCFEKYDLWSEKQLCHFPHVPLMYIVAFLTDVFCINLPTSCYKIMCLNFKEHCCRNIPLSGVLG